VRHLWIFHHVDTHPFRAAGVKGTDQYSRCCFAGHAQCFCGHNDYRGAVIHNKIILNYFDDEETLANSLQQFLLEHPLQAAPVSLDFPLLSNQDVYMNIALIKKYHENLPRDQARKLVLQYLERLGIEHIAERRNPVLTQEERFYAMLLRAAMVQDALIVIDQPFKIIPHLPDIQFVMNALKKIDDLYLSCHIYDYRWMKEKYGEL